MEKRRRWGFLLALSETSFTHLSSLVTFFTLQWFITSSVYWKPCFVLLITRSWYSIKEINICWCLWNRTIIEADYLILLSVQSNKAVHLNLWKQFLLFCVCMVTWWLTLYRLTAQRLSVWQQHCFFLSFRPIIDIHAATAACEKATLLGLKQILKELAPQQPRTSPHVAASELNLICFHCIM